MEYFQMGFFGWLGAQVGGLVLALGLIVLLFIYVIVEDFIKERKKKKMKTLEIKIYYPSIEFLDCGFNIEEVREYPDETDPDNWIESYCIPELNLWGFDTVDDLLFEIAKKYGYDDFNVKCLE